MRRSDLWCRLAKYNTRPFGSPFDLRKLCLIVGFNNKLTQQIATSLCIERTVVAEWHFILTEEYSGWYFFCSSEWPFTPNDHSLAFRYILCNISFCLTLSELHKATKRFTDFILLDQWLTKRILKKARCLCLWSFLRKSILPPPLRIGNDLDEYVFQCHQDSSWYSLHET
jgi:hypothetical protein